MTDRITKGHISVVWCPTADMTSDYFTKPNQGALFKKFRDLVTGIMPQPDPGLGKSKGKPGKSKLARGRRVGKHG